MQPTSDGGVRATCGRSCQHSKLLKQPEITPVRLFGYCGGMLNTPTFGEFVKAARGTRSQADLAGKADTFRQRFGQIESGQPHDLTETALAQLDAAFEWPTEFAQAALRATLNDHHDTHPTTYQPYDASDRGPCRLGYFADGSVLTSVNRIASTAPAAAFFPMIAAAGRTTLIDIHALDDDERLALGGLASQWNDITNASGRAVCTIAANPDSIGTGWTPIAIDPLPGITSLSQALTLTRRLRPIIEKHLPTDDMAIALSLLAAAIDLGDAQHKLGQSTHTNGIALIARPQGRSTSWGRLLEVAGLPPHRYQRVDLTRVFRGLFDARDALIDIAYDPGAATPISMRRQPEVVAAQDLNGALLLFDSHLTPELPVVVHAALAAAGHLLPTVITGAADLFSDDFTGLVIDIHKIATALPTDRDWLRQWSAGELKYATITNYDSVTRRAVYTEGGRSHGIDLPDPYPVSDSARTMPS